MSDEETQLFPDIQSKESLVYKHVTQEKWEKLCNHKTETCGFTLAQVRMLSYLFH